jgi:hypothetical protein
VGECLRYLLDCARLAEHSLFRKQANYIDEKYPYKTPEEVETEVNRDDGSSKLVRSVSNPFLFILIILYPERNETDR